MTIGQTEIRDMLLEDVCYLRKNLQKSRSLLEEAQTWVNNPEVANRIEEFLRDGAREDRPPNFVKQPLRAV